MGESSHKKPVGASRRRRWSAIAAIVGTAVGVLSLLAALLLPGFLESSAGSSLRDALRKELPPTAEVRVAVSLGWTSPSSAVVDVRDGDGVAALLEVSTGRSLLDWIGPVLGGAIGDVPIEFAIDARFEGAAGRAFLEQLRERDAAAEAAATDSSADAGPATGDARGTAWPDGLEIAATGSIDLALVDRERGVDVAIASDRVQLDLSEDRSFEAALELRVARAGEVERTDGRVRIAGTLAEAIRTDGSLDLAAAAGELSIDGGRFEFDWNRESVAVESLAMAAGLDAGEGLSIELAGAGNVGGRGAVLEADLAWRSPFDDRGAWRRDFAGLGGSGRLSGVPIAAFTRTLTPELARMVEDLGGSLEAEWSLPIESDALAIAATTDLATLAASARLERDAGRLADGAIRIEAALTPPPQDPDRGDAGEVVPVRLIASGIEYRAGELEVATAELVAERALAPLVDLLGSHAAVEVLVDAPIEAKADSIRWRLAEGVQALEARGVLSSEAILRVGGAGGEFAGTLSGPRIEWFAEPLGRALSIRGEVGLDDGTLRFDERLDGLWTGRGWLPATSLRPHGTASIDRLDPGLLTAALPEGLRSAWTRQAQDPLELQVSTRVEGDRLEGVLRATGATTDLRVPLSIDAQRIAVGPVEASLTLRREALAALPDAWTGGVEFASDLETTFAVEPVLLPIETLSGRGVEMPALELAYAVAAVPIASAPELAAGSSLSVRDLRGRVSIGDEGVLSIDGAASLGAGVGEGTETALTETALGALRFGVETSADGAANARVEISSLEASSLLSMLSFSEGSVLENPASRDWLGRLEVEMRWRGRDLAISARGPAIEAVAAISRAPGQGSVVDSFDLVAAVPAAAVSALAGEALGTLRPAGVLRVRGEGRGVALDGASSSRGELVLELDPIEWSVGEGDAVSQISQVSLVGHRAVVVAAPDDGGFDVRLGPIGGDAPGTAIGFDGRLARGVASSAWALDGRGSLRGVPVAVLDGVLEDDGLLAKVLGSPFEASFVATSLGTTHGEVSGEATFPNGVLRLPSLLVEGDSLRIPAETPFVGEVEFGAGLAEVLEDLSPMLGSIESLETPVRLEIADAVLPRAGVDRSLLSGDLRLEIGRGRFRPRGVLQLALEALDDANAGGFAGEATPLVARIREGRLDYRDFELRFVPFRDGWRNTIVSRGSIDLVSTPAIGEFTMTFPARSLAAYSSEIRRILETRPQLLEAISVPLTLRGPLDGSAPLERSIEFDPKPLIEAGVETLIEEGFRRLLDGLK